MRHYESLEGDKWSFADTDFDEDGNVINEIVKQKIEENSLTEIPEHKYKEWLAAEEIKRIEVANALSKLPSQEEREKNKIELIILNLLSEGGLI